MSIKEYRLNICFVEVSVNAEFCWFVKFRSGGWPWPSCSTSYIQIRSHMCSNKVIWLVFYTKWCWSIDHCSKCLCFAWFYLNLPCAICLKSHNLSGNRRIIKYDDGRQLKSPWSSRYCVSLLHETPGFEPQARVQNKIRKELYDWYSILNGADLSITAATAFVLPDFI